MFLSGIFTGFTLGIFVMCLMRMAGSADPASDSTFTPKNPRSR